MEQDSPDPTRQPGGERPLSRRDALRTIGRGLTFAGGVGAASAPVAARPVGVFADAKPDAVTITHDGEWLKQYRPMLDTRSVPYDNRPTLYGWRVSSRDPSVETEVGVYCCEYAVQEDILTLTSHPGDHEWIYVYVDEDTGEVSEVSYTAYHWLRGYLLNPSVNGEDGGSHPMFRIAPTYHNYIPMTSPTDTSVLLEPRSLGSYSETEPSGPLYQWLENGMSEDMEPGAVHEPWILDSDGRLDGWWREDSEGLNKWLLDAWAFLGFGLGLDVAGADSANFGDAGGPRS